ncbi:hypothetical protein PB1_08032 [Bacillus methanolicus PB1]|uniref:Uncharacterized protein n=1 Tax=Bacillus methanolicus PB1 TaxID=997296 RepID=I3E1C3_BACMT|nr:hypothetical protein [Bacillus methanolicus]EIJ80294.1 hypothetical protein PB1_08032 [Bacillus methanolicus PB1]
MQLLNKVMLVLNEEILTIYDPISSFYEPSIYIGIDIEDETKIEKANKIFQKMNYNYGINKKKT